MLNQIKLSKEISFNNTVQTGETLESYAVNVSATASGANIAMMLAHIYANPFESALRETISNALDATTEKWVGNSEIPQVEILVSENSIGVKDYGVGMDKNTLLNAFGTYFASTKKDDMNVIGAYGLGAKAPLAYADSFTGITTRGGQTITFMVRKDVASGVALDILTDEMTGNPDGTTITIPLTADDPKLPIVGEYVADFLYSSENLRVILDPNVENRLTSEVEVNNVKYYADTAMFIGNIQHEGLNLPVYLTETSYIEYFIKILEKNDSEAVHMIFDVNGILYHNDTWREKDGLIVQAPPGLISFPASREVYTENKLTNLLKQKIVDLAKEHLADALIDCYGGIGAISKIMSVRTKSFLVETIFDKICKKVEDVTDPEFIKALKTVFYSKDGRSAKTERGLSGKGTLVYSTETPYYAYKGFMNNLKWIKGRDQEYSIIIFPKKTLDATKHLEAIAKTFKGKNPWEIENVDHLLQKTPPARKTTTKNTAVTPSVALTKNLRKTRQEWVYPDSDTIPDMKIFGKNFCLGEKTSAKDYANATVSILLSENLTDIIKTPLDINSIIYKLPLENILKSIPNWITKNIIILAHSTRTMPETIGETDQKIVEQIEKTFQSDEDGTTSFTLIQFQTERSGNLLRKENTNFINCYYSTVMLTGLYLQETGHNVIYLADINDETHRKNPKKTKQIEKIAKKTGQKIFTSSTRNLNTVNKMSSESMVTDTLEQAVKKTSWQTTMTPIAKKLLNILDKNYEKQGLEEHIRNKKTLKTLIREHCPLNTEDDSKPQYKNIENYLHPETIIYQNIMLKHFGTIENAHDTIDSLYRLLDADQEYPDYLKEAHEKAVEILEENIITEYKKQLKENGIKIPAKTDVNDKQ